MSSGPVLQSVVKQPFLILRWLIVILSVVFLYKCITFVNSLPVIISKEAKVQIETLGLCKKIPVITEGFLTI